MALQTLRYVTLNWENNGFPMKDYQLKGGPRESIELLFVEDCRLPATSTTMEIKCTIKVYNE